MKIFRFLLPGFLMLTITACNLTPVKKNNLAIVKKNPKDLISWQFKGRVAIHTKKDSQILRIQWIQNKNNINLRIYGSFGKTYARLLRVDGLSTLEVDDKTYQDNNAELLLWRVLGWQIPINEMSYWIRGISGNAALSPLTTINSSGYLKTLDYNNWHVTYDKYKIFSHYPLPTKIKLTHPDLSLKFSIQKWITLPES